MFIDSCPRGYPKPDTNEPRIPDWAEDLLPRDLLERIPMDWWVPPKDGLPGPATPGPDGTRIPLPIDPDLGDDIADRIGDIVTWLLNILNQNGEGQEEPGSSSDAPDHQEPLPEADSNNYRKIFFEAFPDIDPDTTLVHHAIEQQVLKLFDGIINRKQLNHLNNLRGIPKDINGKIHLSEIRKLWNSFYKKYDGTGLSPTIGDLLDYAQKIDDRYGHLFTPPVR